MTTVDISATTVHLPEDEFVVDEAHLAAVAFLARYNGRTLDAYRHDLCGFFQRAADNSLDVLAATRPHIELYRSWMEERGQAASAEHTTASDIVREALRRYLKVS
jgi:site-specific recombinase XerD